MTGWLTCWLADLLAGLLAGWVADCPVKTHTYSDCILRSFTLLFIVIAMVVGKVWVLLVYRILAAT